MSDKPKSEEKPDLITRRGFVTHAAADVVSAIDLGALRTLLASATPDELARRCLHVVQESTDSICDGARH